MPVAGFRFPPRPANNCIQFARGFRPVCDPCAARFSSRMVGFLRGYPARQLLQAHWPIVTYAFDGSVPLLLPSSARCPERTPRPVGLLPAPSFFWGDPLEVRALCILLAIDPGQDRAMPSMRPYRLQPSADGSCRDGRLLLCCHDGRRTCVVVNGTMSVLYARLRPNHRR
jgi:hypothetical protein